MSDLIENSSASDVSGPERSEAVTRTACRQCFELLDVGDNFCRYCGAMTEAGVAMVKIGKLPSPASLQPREKPPSWAENPVVVLLALFAVLGPFALPMLWRSRRFTRGWKIGLSVAVLLVTIAICRYIWYIWQAVGTQIKALKQALQQAGLP